MYLMLTHQSQCTKQKGGGRGNRGKRKSMLVNITHLTNIVYYCLVFNFLATITCYLYAYSWFIIIWPLWYITSVLHLAYWRLRLNLAAAFENLTSQPTSLLVENTGMTSFPSRNRDGRCMLGLVAVTPRVIGVDGIFRARAAAAVAEPLACEKWLRSNVYGTVFWRLMLDPSAACDFFSSKAP